MTDFRPLTRETVRPLAALSVSEDQSKFCSSNLMTMAEATFEPGSEIYGIWEGDAPVGLVAVIDRSHPDAILTAGDNVDDLYIWRFLVDQTQQGRGYGRKTLDFTKSLALKKGRSNLVLTVLDEPGGARPIYEAYGFRSTGRLKDGEVEMVLHLT